jgi:hypothetical protein
MRCETCCSGSRRGRRRPRARREDKGLPKSDARAPAETRAPGGNSAGAARLAHRPPVSTYDVLGRQPTPQRTQAHPSRHTPPRARTARVMPRWLQRCDDDRARLYDQADGRADQRRLATGTAERVATGGKSTEIARVRITDAGLKALIQWHHQARSAPPARGRAFGR